MEENICKLNPEKWVLLKMRNTHIQYKRKKANQTKPKQYH